MLRRPALLLAVTLAALGLPAIGSGADRQVRVAPPPAVVGAGAPNVIELEVHRAPTDASPVIATIPDFRPQDFRPFVVLATARRRVGGDWLRISVPGRPNGQYGWVRTAEVDLRPMPWQLVVRLDSRTLEVWHGSELTHTARVAVGAPGTETPTGLFYVTLRFKPVRQTFLGTFAFETSAYSKLTDWPGGGVVGLHGTWQPGLLGRAVSHGCIRIPNRSANYLRDRIPVGTPIRVVAA